MGLEAHRPIRRCDRGLGEGTVAATEREADGEEGVEKKSQNLELNVGVGLGHR